VEVSVHPKTFLERLRLAGSLTGKRYPSPVLETVQLEVTDARSGWLRATDGQASIELLVPVLKVTHPGVVQLPRNPVVKALTGVKAQGVTIREEPADTLPISPDARTPSRQVTIVAPQGTMTFPTFDPAHFPRLEPDEPEHSVRLPAWRFSRLVKRTLFAADEDATRWALGGCHLVFAEGELLAVGTDGRVIAHATEPAEGSGLVAPQTTIVGGEERPLAPVVLMKPLKALVSALEGIENAELELAFTVGERFQARTTSLFFSVRLPEGRFPSSWREVFPGSASYGCRVDDPPRLAKALKDMLRFTVQGSRSTELRLSGHSLTLSVQNDEAKAQTQVTVRNLSETRDEAATTIDPEYLLRFLDASGQPFDLWFPPEKGTPLVCRGEAHRYALMPMDRSEGPPAQATGDQAATAQAATEEPPRCPQEEPPAEEAQTKSA
jgi:DNA polymerase III sliding clamp (beta) subunit (PCNA family)